MKETEIETILKKLKEGEPFHFIRIDDKLYIGVKMGYSETHEEYQIFECFDYKVAKEGLIKIKKRKKGKTFWDKW